MECFSKIRAHLSKRCFPNPKFIKKQLEIVLDIAKNIEQDTKSVKELLYELYKISRKITLDTVLVASTVASINKDDSLGSIYEKTQEKLQKDILQWAKIATAAQVFSRVVEGAVKQGLDLDSLKKCEEKLQLFQYQLHIFLEQAEPAIQQHANAPVQLVPEKKFDPVLLRVAMAFVIVLTLAAAAADLLVGFLKNPDNLTLHWYILVAIGIFGIVMTVGLFLLGNYSKKWAKAILFMVLSTLTLLLIIATILIAFLLPDRLWEVVGVNGSILLAVVGALVALSRKLVLTKNNKNNSNQNNDNNNP